MRRFGSIFPFLESGRQARQLGRLVANHEFVRALVKYGTFDEYVFSNTSISNLRIFAETVRQWGLDDDRLARIACVSYVELPRLLREQSFQVFHLGGWGAQMPGLHYLRSSHARNPWPITGITHSLHGRDVIDHAVRLSHARMAPYDAIFCTSRDGREAMRRLLAEGAAISGGCYEGGLEHLPLGIDDDLFDTRGNRDRARGRLKIPSDATVLLVLGRMSACQKMDVTPLLRAFANEILPNCHRPVILVLAGGASADDLTLLRQSIDRYGLDPHVRLHANFPEEQKADVLAASDVLVSPVDNTQETFGLSLLEAMAAGLPIVASRFDGYKDLVEDGVSGFLIDTYASLADPMEEWADLLDPNIAQLFQSQGVAVDLGQLVDRLLRLVRDEALRAEMGAAGRVRGSRDYRWSRVIARYEATWDRLFHQAQHGGVAPAPSQRNPFALGPRHLFSHYPSHTLTPDSQLIATAPVIDLAAFNETSIVLQPTLLRAILELSQDATTLEALTAAVRARSDHTAYAVAWLLKYGALRVLA